MKSYLDLDVHKQTDWDKNLGCLAMTYRSTPQESTKFTPNMIMLGREVKLPLQMVFTKLVNSEECSTYGNYLYDLRENLYRSEEPKMCSKGPKGTYNKGSHLKQYKTGDLVSNLIENPYTNLESYKLQPR